MIICYNHFTKASTPKFLQNALSILGQAQGAAFLTRADLGVFVNNIRKRLHQDRPVGSSWDVTDIRYADGSGQVSVYRTDNPDGIAARFQYQECRKVLRWETGRDRFFDIIHRIED